MEETGVQRDGRQGVDAKAKMEIREAEERQRSERTKENWSRNSRDEIDTWKRDIL